MPIYHMLTLYPQKKILILLKPKAYLCWALFLLFHIGLIFNRLKSLNMNTIKFFENKIFLIFSIIVFTGISCEQDLKIEITTNDKRLIVVGEFTSDTIIHSVNLYRSGSLITGSNQSVESGAKVYVTDKIDTFYYEENDSTPGLYETLGKCYGKGGTVYYLSITNIDIENDGQMDSFSANVMMPVPIKFDSLVSKTGINGDGDMAVNNYAYYNVFYDGPDYIYKYTLLNNQSDYGTLSSRLGTGEISAFEREYKVPKVSYPDSFINYRSYLSINSEVLKGDTITFICNNYTTNQFEFLQAFDNNASGDLFMDNFYDQLNVPSNLPTNIEPYNKAAGYFFVYSVSRINKVFNE
jgi:hypothetical protein